MKSLRLRRVALFSLILTFAATSVFSLVGNFYYGGSRANAQSLTAIASEFGIPLVNNAPAIDTSLFTLKWLNAAELEMTFNNGQKVVFTPDNEGGGLPELVDQRQENVQVDYSIRGWACDWNNMNTGSSINDPITSVDIDIDFKPSASGECTDAGNLRDVPVQNPEMSIAYFRWVDSAKIEPVQYFMDDSFVAEDPVNFPNLFASQKETKCRNKILVDPATNTMKYYDLNDGGSDFGDLPIDPNIIQAGDCEYREVPVNDDYGRDIPPRGNFDYPIADVQNRSLAAGTGTSENGDTAIGTVSGDENPTCESSGFGLTWALCPLINGALDATDWFFRVAIEPYLRINPVEVSSDDYVYQIWSSFRTIGNILLVFGLLFIVFGQAIGGGLVDAYTAKKVLPRILVAAVLVNLSIYIVAIMVDISNVVGMGIGQLITAPLKDGGFFNFDIGNASGQIIAATGLAATLIGGGLMALAFTGRGGGATTAGSAAGGIASSIGSAIVPILFFVVVPILIAAISVFGTLIIRRGIVLFLAIVSPVAMALYTIPATEKYAKQWFGLLLKTLMMYPIIVAIFAIGDVLGTIILNSGTEGAVGGQLASTLTGLMVLFAPMFMIPFSFKLAGGAISTVYGTLTKSDKLIRGDKHDVHGRYHRWSNSARERGKEAMDAGMDRAGGKLTTLGAPGRWASRRTKGAQRRSRERVLVRAYNEHKSGFLRQSIDPATGQVYTDPGEYSEWVKNQRQNATNGTIINRQGGIGNSSYGPALPSGTGTTSTPTATAGSTASPFAPPTGPALPPPAGAVITPATSPTVVPTPAVAPPTPSSGSGGSTPAPSTPPPTGPRPSGAPAPGSPLPPPTGTPIPPPPPSGSPDAATGALISAAGEVRAAAGELREAARRTGSDSGPRGGDGGSSSAGTGSSGGLNIPRNSSTGGPSFS